MSKPCLLAALLLSLTATPAAFATLPDPDLGQRRHPNRQHDPGPTGRTFEHRGPQIDERINALDGALGLSLPLGHEYPLSSRSGYAFALRYTSNVWDFAPFSPGGNAALPGPLDNAGLGWSLSFGRLLAPTSAFNPSADWLYVDPGGDVHAFHSTLYDGVADDDPAGAVFYTRDGSFLRLDLRSPGAPRLDLRDGTRHTFAPSGDTWTLSESRDPSGNVLTFQRSPGLVVVSDSHGREHRIYLRPGSAEGAPELVDRLEVAAFGGTVAGYLFTYDEVPVVRSCHDDAAATPAEATVSRLTAILLPDGSRYAFTYHPSSAGCRSAGRLASVTLPAGGRHEYLYADYPLGNAWCTPPEAAYLKNPVGLWKRTLRRADGQEVGTWVYTPSPIGEGGESADACARNLFLRSTETDPEGHKTRHFLSLATRSGPTPVGFTDAPSTYGLPMRLGFPDASRPELMQTRKTFDCPAGCTLLEYATGGFVQDGACDPAGLSCVDSHRRAVAERLYSADDGHRYVEVDFEDYDGLGNFRRRVQNDTYGEGTVGTLTETVDFHPDRGTYPVTFTMPSVDLPWILHTFTTWFRGDSTGSVVSEHCFDPATGNLERLRLRASAAGQTARDIVVTYETLNGNVVEEKRYGGDVQDLTADDKGESGYDLCTLDLPSAEQSWISRTFDHGVLATEVYLDAGGAPVPFLTVDRTLDPSTGLTVASRGRSGLETTFQYDALGRETWRRPETGGDALTETVYVPATAGEAAVRHRRRIARADGSVLRETVQTLDGFGRIAEERRRLPGSDAWTLILTRYDADGLESAISEPHAPGETPVYTEVVRRDPFGRPLGHVYPDGSTSETTYTGRRVETLRESWAAFKIDGLGALEADLEKITVFDGRGRTVRSESVRYFEPEKSSPPEIQVLESTLDVTGRVVGRLENGEAEGPTRTYDGRGLLVAEIQPAGSGLPSRTGFRYDAAGRLVQVRRGSTELAWDYDRAGRQLKVYDVLDPGNPWLETEYDGGPGCTGCLGRPVTRIRHNRYPAGSALAAGDRITVTEDLRYDGVGHRVSERTVEIRDGGQFPRVHAFQEQRTYTELGKLETLRYPHCQSCSGDAPGPERRLNYSYEQGYLTSLEGTEDGQAQDWLRSVIYHPGGRPYRTTFGNGVFATFERDPAWPGRVGRVVVDYTFYRDYDSGDLTYDSVGRVIQTGTEWAIPGYGDRRQAAAPAPPRGEADLCFVDPFGAPLSSRRRPDCTNGEGTAVFAYDADGREVYRFTVDERRFQLYGTDGERLREWIRDYQDWSRTVDTVYRGETPLAEVQVEADGSRSIHYEHDMAPSSNAIGAMLYADLQNLTSPFEDPSWMGTGLPQKNGSGCIEAGVPCPERINWVGGCVTATLWDNRLGCELYRDYRGEVVTVGGTESVDSCRVACTSCCNVYGSTSPQQIEAMEDICDLILGVPRAAALQALLDAGIELGEALLEAADTPFGLEILVDTCSALVEGLYIPGSANECRRQCDERFRDEDGCRNLVQPISPRATPGGGPPVWGPEDCMRWRHDGDERRGGADWTCETPAASVPAQADLHCFLQERCGRPASELGGERPKRRIYICEVRNADPVEGQDEEEDEEEDDEPSARGGGGGRRGVLHQAPPPPPFGGGRGGGGLPWGTVTQGPHGFPGSPNDPCRIYGGCGPGF